MKRCVLNALFAITLVLISRLEAADKYQIEEIDSDDEEADVVVVESGSEDEHETPQIPERGAVIKSTREEIERRGQMVSGDIGVVLDIGTEIEGELFTFIKLRDSIIYTARERYSFYKVIEKDKTIWVSEKPEFNAKRVIFSFRDLSIVIISGETSIELRLENGEWHVCEADINSEIKMFTSQNGFHYPIQQSKHKMRKLYGDRYLYQVDPSVSRISYESIMWDMGLGKRPLSMTYEKNRKLRLRFDDCFLDLHLEVKKRLLTPPEEIRFFTQNHYGQLEILHRGEYRISTSLYDGFDYHFDPRITVVMITFAEQIFWSANPEQPEKTPTLLTYKEDAIVLHFRNMFEIYRKWHGIWSKQEDIERG